MSLRPVFLLLAMSLAASAAAAPPERLPLTLVVHAEPSVEARLREGVSRSKWPPLDLRHVELPTAPEPSAVPPPRHELEKVVEDAHVSYLAARFARCLDALGGDDLVPRLVGEEQYTLAGRVALWRVACSVGLGERDTADQAARAFIRLGFDAPVDLDRVTPEVLRTVDRARRAIAESPQLVVQVRSAARRAHVFVDTGKNAHALPAQLALPQGEHVLRIVGDGIRTEWRQVLVTTEGQVIDWKATPATPQLAMEQWLARYASADLDAQPSLELLSLALSSRRLVMLDVERAAKTLRVRGALVTDERLVAHAERTLRNENELAAAGPAVVQELLENSGQIKRLPPITRRPAFWVSIGAAALVAAGAVLLITLYPKKVEVSF